MESLTQYDGFCERKRCLILIHRAKDHFKGKTHHLYTHTRTHTNTVKLIPRGIAIRQNGMQKLFSLCWRCEKFRQEIPFNRVPKICKQPHLTALINAHLLTMLNTPNTSISVLRNANQVCDIKSYKNQQF